MCCCLPTVVAFVVEKGCTCRCMCAVFLYVRECVREREREIDGALVIVGLESLPGDKEETQPHS